MRICDGWRHACEVANVAVPTRELDAAANAQLEEWTSRSECGQIDLDAFAAGVSPLLGLAARDVCAISDAYLLAPFPGVDELLDQLSSRPNLRTACLSNTNANHWRIMTDAGHPAALPLHRLDYQFASHLIGLRKPWDSIYAHVERATSLPGESIIFFDDVDENVVAAKRRGWQAHRVTPCDDPLAQVRRVLSDAGVID